MHTASPQLATKHLITHTIALLLGLLGMGVLLSWHNPHLLAGLYPYATLMAYNTAIGFCACGLGLYAIIARRWLLKSLVSIVLIAIGLLTLLDLIIGIPLNTTTWFEILLTEPPVRNQSISPTTSTAFLLASGALLFGYTSTGTNTIIACSLCVVILFIILTAMLGQYVGPLSTFVWLGTKIAPHTAIGFTLFAIGLMVQRTKSAVDAFNRLNVFSRLATGFLFMSLLSVGLGSIGSLQVNSVASITQELYENPVQVSHAVLRIKSSVNKLNRRLKDIAVNPLLADSINIPAEINQIDFSIEQEFMIIERKIHSENTRMLRDTIRHWRATILTNHEQLIAGNIDIYRINTLNEIQELSIHLERQCESLLADSQNRMLELSTEANSIRNQANNLMLIVICGFLFVGIIVVAMIARSLNWQLQHIHNTMEQLIRGDTKIDIPFLDHPNAMGVMAKTLTSLAENIAAHKQNAQLLTQHQLELESSNHRLAQTNKELETFAYVASHDLKSPLRGITQLSTWIEEDLAAKEFSEVEKHTVMLRNRIQRMERLLDDMLVFYRAGKVDGKLTKVNVRHMATELFEIQNTKPGLHLELGNELPEFETLGTPFEQVLRNLFSNAIKHHDRNQGIVRLECKCPDAYFYEFSVTDDGPGIPAKFQERVFGMFQTLKPRDELEGSGMGLALIKKLVEVYGGTITVFSKGRGCRFTFTWPQSMRES